MPQESETAEPSDFQLPDKCADCRFFDREVDHMLEVPQVYLYCRAPVWHPKRWTCRLPDQVERG
jgi:hypothetical protein